MLSHSTFVTELFYSFTFQCAKKRSEKKLVWINNAPANYFLHIILIKDFMMDVFYVHKKVLKAQIHIQR